MSAEKLKYWYCPNCRTEVDSRNVTFEEKHDTCGHNAEWIQQTQTERERKLYEALKEAKQLLDNQLIESELIEQTLNECKPNKEVCEHCNGYGRKSANVMLGHMSCPTCGK